MSESTAISDPHQSFFARWAKFYEATPLLGPILRSQQEAAIELLSPRRGERVLDLGCGPGRGLKLLRQRGAHAVGFDPSRAMLRSARGVAPVSCAQALALPLRSGALDGLLCTNSFHHHPEPLATLREMRRVLKEGGRAVLVDPNLAHPLARLIIYGGEALLFGMGVHLHSADEWRALCMDAGFAQVSVEPLLPALLRRLVLLPSIDAQLRRIPGLARLPDPSAFSLCITAWA